MDILSPRAAIRAVLLAVTLAASLALVGCGNAGGGQATATDADAGLTMQLPAGWSQGRDGIYSQRGQGDHHHGMVYLIDLEGDAGEGSLEQRVSEAAGLNLDGPDIVSRQRMEVAGHDALEIISAATYHLYEIYIVQDDRLIVVSFRTLPEAFDDQLDAFRAAVRSIRLQ